MKYKTLKIGVLDKYTQQGKKYYDYSLTNIKKGKLLDLIKDQAVKPSNFTTMGNASVPSYERLCKDKKIKQTIFDRLKKILIFV